MAKQKVQTSQAVKDAQRPRNEARTAENKRRRVEAQELQRQANVVRRHMGTPTPWEAQKAIRARRPKATGAAQSDYVLAS